MKEEKGEKIMSDSFQEMGDSLVHHGKFNNRIFILKFNLDNDFSKSIASFESLAKENKYTKIIIKAPASYSPLFLAREYLIEGYIPKYLSDYEDLVFFSKFIDKTRALDDMDLIAKNIQIATSKKKVLPPEPDKYSFIEFREDLAEDLSQLYLNVFGKSYPFPIFEKAYLLETMKGDLSYFVCIHDKKLVSACSLDKASRELSDFATLASYRGNNLSLHLTKLAENKAKDLGIKTIFSLARSESVAMNVSFSKSSYNYSGTLIKNANIAGKLESLNIWYKDISKN